MLKEMNNPDPVSASDYPTLQPFTGTFPNLSPAWECVALLHPFSPIQSNSTQADKDSPFFELCVAYINYQQGQFLSAQLAGSSGRMWWYIITPNETLVSTNGTSPHTQVDMGWTLPNTNWLRNATCAGTSYLNWMKAQEVSWWKIPVGTASPAPATWMWFDAASNLPVRMMFGQGPLASPSMGDPNQLALFQMFSFTYFPVFNPLQSTVPPLSWTPPTFAGFELGNPNGFELFTWNDNFGMTAFMTPVNEAFDPLPTRILYVWKPDDQYQVTSDRSQNSLMMYNYNPGNSFTSQMALLTGKPPQGVTPPPYSESGFLINYSGDEITNCQTGNQFPFPQEAPNWIATQGAQGTIQACVTDNPVLCPNNTVMILSLLFPPSTPNYPDSTYLWTWYSPLPGSDGSRSRPVTFMQSQSGVGVGTSLALADYFYYKEFEEPIVASNFVIQLQFPPGTPNPATD